MENTINENSNVEKLKRKYQFKWVEFTYKDGKTVKKFVIDVIDDHQDDGADYLEDPWYNAFVVSDEDQTKDFFEKGIPMGGDAIKFNELKSVRLV